MGLEGKNLDCTYSFGARASKFASSLARPGANMTGFANFEFAIAAKWLEVLKEIAPATSQVALMLQSRYGPYYTGYMQSVQALALSNTVQATLAPVRNVDQIGREVPQGGLPPHHSITSSARASSVGGISRPSALAVLRLMTSSYLVGTCTADRPASRP